MHKFQHLLLLLHLVHFSGIFFHTLNILAMIYLGSLLSANLVYTYAIGCNRGWPSALSALLASSLFIGWPRPNTASIKAQTEPQNPSSLTETNATWVFELRHR